MGSILTPLPLLIIGLSLIVGGSLAQDQQPPFRLPTSIVPTSYVLEIISVLDEIPQFQRFTAPGKVWIRVNCTEATRVIKLHSVDLDLQLQNIYVYFRFIQITKILILISSKIQIL